MLNYVIYSKNDCSCYEKVKNVIDRSVNEYDSDMEKYIYKDESINLYFTSNNNTDHVGRIHRLASKDEDILALYYS